MQANLYTRSAALPAKPVIVQAVSFGHDSASLKLATDLATNADAPIAFYTITINRVDSSTAAKVETKRIYSWRDLELAVTGLQGRTTYTFTVTATTVDGTSAVSLASLPVTTPAYVPSESSASSSNSSTVAAPAFTLSRSFETRTVGISNTGYTIQETGGTIASFSISPDLPGGLNINPSTGLITGSPTETKTATTYTITGTNSAGSASATYRLRVTGDIGDIGPGGGRIFYYLAAGFNCGLYFTETGSATGGKCKYLEVSPRNWWGGSSDTSTTWANNSLSLTGISDETSIGVGRSHTRLIVASGLFTSSAAQLATTYTITIDGVIYNDWYLGSEAEMTSLVQTSVGASLDVNYGVAHWTSTQRGLTNTSARYVQMTMTGSPPTLSFLASGNTKDGYSNIVRPIRAF
jgi:hypothetical protein